MAIMTAAQWHFYKAQLYPGNQSILTQMRRKAGWGSRSQGARSLSGSLSVREGNGLMAKEAFIWSWVLQCALFACQNQWLQDLGFSQLFPYSNNW